MLFAICQRTVGQQVELPKATFAMHTGFLFGVWGNYEARLGQRTVFLTEAGFSFQSMAVFTNEGKEDVITPVLLVGPRRYFKSKISKKKSGSARITRGFLGAHIKFKPNSFFLDSDGLYGYANHLGVFPNIGMKKTMGERFVMELALGVGYAHYFAKQEGWPENIDRPTVDLRIRFGFNL